MNAQDEPVRFGLVGCGAWGSQHARAIAKTPGAQFAAIAEQSEQNRAAAQAAHPGAAIYADYQEMLRKEKLEAVDIVLPPHLHHEGAKAALAAGCHVLLEKPMCLQLGQWRADSGRLSPGPVGLAQVPARNGPAAGDYVARPALSLGPGDYLLSAGDQGPAAAGIAARSPKAARTPKH